jgi:hypothetical protein
VERKGAAAEGETEDRVSNTIGMLCSAYKMHQDPAGPNGRFNQKKETDTYQEGGEKNAAKRQNRPAGSRF